MSPGILVSVIRILCSVVALLKSVLWTLLSVGLEDLVVILVSVVWRRIWIWFVCSLLLRQEISMWLLSILWWNQGWLGWLLGSDLFR